MDTVEVWIRSLGDACHMRANGRSHVDWLRRRLKKQGLRMTAVKQLEGTSSYTFSVHYTPHWHHTRLEDLLRDIPEVELHRDAQF